MWGCFLMSGVKILHFLKDWWKSIPIHQNYTMALTVVGSQILKLLKLIITMNHLHLQGKTELGWSFARPLGIS